MQQINLYQPILRKQEKVFSLKTLLRGNLLILAVLLLFYFASYYQSHSLNTQLESLQQERTKRTEALIELQKKFPPKAKNPTLQTMVEEKQALLNHRKRIIRELQHQKTGTGGNPGFSEQLSGLARQDVEGIWFDQISLRDGKQLTLQGWATSPEKVPQLIQRLTSEPSFSGTAFTSVQITRDTQNSSVIGFILKTDDNEEGAAQ